MVSVLLNLWEEHEEICAENELLAILTVTAGSGNDIATVRANIGW